jgi:hypothetical protein
MDHLTGLSVATKTGAYTVTQQDCVVLVDATAGAVTITLPAASSLPGHLIVIRKVDAGINAVSITRTGADLVDGLVSVALAAQFSGRLLLSDGASRWHILTVL